MDKLTGQIIKKKEINGVLGMPSSGATDYNLLFNKPSIDDVPLIGNKTLTEFGEREITNLEIQDIIDSVFN